MKVLKEMYGLIYGEMPSGAEPQKLYREVERIKEPLRGRTDFEEIEEACLEVSCCSEESGFIRGFRAGVAFMAECLAERE